MSLCTKSLETVFRRHSKRNHTSLHQFSPPSAHVASHRKLLSSVPFFVATERTAETTVAQVHHDSCTEQMSEKSATVRKKETTLRRALAKLPIVIRTTHSSSHEQLSIALPTSRSRITRLRFQQFAPHSFLCPTYITRRFTLLCCSSSARKTDLVRMCRAKKHLRSPTRPKPRKAVGRLSLQAALNSNSIYIKNPVPITNHVRSGASNQGPQEVDKPQLHQRCAVDYTRGRPLTVEVNVSVQPTTLRSPTSSRQTIPGVNR